MKDGYIRVSAVTTEIKVADVSFNIDAIIKAMKAEIKKHTKICVFPELCVTGSTCGDLFNQSSLMRAVEKGLDKLAKVSEDHDTLFFIGLPWEDEGEVFDAVAAIQDGNILSIAPIDSNVLYRCNQIPELTLSVGCTDLGALVVAYPDAAMETVYSAEYTRMMVKADSARYNCAYLYANAGKGESSSEAVYAGGNLIAENGKIIAETEAFTVGAATTEIDIQAILADRKKYDYDLEPEEAEEIEFDLKVEPVKLTREIAKHPFVPEADVYEKTLSKIIKIQSEGLRKRLEHIGCTHLNIGISGGLDSTLALIVAVETFDAMGIDRKNIHAITMPCFGTSDRTYNNACSMIKKFGCKFDEISIKDAVTQHFKDIRHDMKLHNVAYENAQARERTQILMDMANDENGLVVGTGDMSELALGWATYNGDHMSMYAVNSSVPKTLMRHLVTYYANKQTDKKLKEILLDVVDTPVSPELLPPVKGKISQKTEDLVGPYDLHDFYIYYVLRYGFRPAKIYRLAQIAWGKEYSNKELYKWLENFYRRFFSQQYKRSCMPDGPLVGTIGLSSHTELKIPSDASRNVWMEELAAIKI